MQMNGTQISRKCLVQFLCPLIIHFLFIQPLLQRDLSPTPRSLKYVFPRCVGSRGCTATLSPNDFLKALNSRQSLVECCSDISKLRNIETKTGIEGAPKVWGTHSGHIHGGLHNTNHSVIDSLPLSPALRDDRSRA